MVSIIVITPSWPAPETIFVKKLSKLVILVWFSLVLLSMIYETSEGIELSNDAVPRELGFSPVIDETLNVETKTSPAIPSSMFGVPVTSTSPNKNWSNL